MACKGFYDSFTERERLRQMQRTYLKMYIMEISGTQEAAETFLGGEGGRPQKRARSLITDNSNV